MMNWTKTAQIGALVLLAGAAGCIGETSDPQPDFPEVDEAIVEPETVEVFFDESDLPGEEGAGESSSGLSVAEQGLVGDPARLIPPMRDGLKTANALLRPGLIILNEIAKNHQPALQSNTQLLWRVEQDQIRFTLLLDRDTPESSRWSYALFVRPADRPRSTMHLLLSGFFEPGPRTEDGRQTGAGLLRYEYDALRRIGAPDAPAAGVGAVGFKVTPTNKQLVIFLYTFRRQDQLLPTNARYEYDLMNDGTGRFRFFLEGDFEARLPGRERWHEMTVWSPDRSGRGRARFSSAVLEDDLEVQECWDADLRQVWTRWSPSPPENERNDGDEAACEEFADTELPLPDRSPPEEDEPPPVPE